MVIMMTFLTFTSCGKEKYDVPPAIQRIIDNGGYEDRILLGMGEYSYNGEVVYMCLYGGYGWFSTVRFFHVTTGDGFSIGEARGWSKDFRQCDPASYRGCMEDFVSKGVYVRGVYGEWCDFN